jgi:hypothetical protein
LVFFGVFALVGIALVAWVAAGSAPWPVATLWLLGLGWNAYWWLLRIGVSIEVVDQVLTWRAPLRTRSLPLTSVIPSKDVWGGVGRLRVDDERSLLTLGGNDEWLRFRSTLARARGTAYEATRAERFRSRFAGVRAFSPRYYEG